jgi:hypothetical protein
MIEFPNLYNDANAAQETSARPPRVSLLNDRFTLLDENGQEAGEVHGEFKFMVAYIRPSVFRVFYGSKYDPENPSGPACVSYDGKRPDATESPEPQHELCSACPRAVWGSKEGFSGGKSRECQNRVLVVAMTSDKKFWQFAIPPASQKNWKLFVDEQRRTGKPLQAMIAGAKFRRGTKILEFVARGTAPLDYQEAIATFTARAGENMTGPPRALDVELLAPYMSLTPRLTHEPEPEPAPEPEPKPVSKRRAVKSPEPPAEADEPAAEADALAAHLRQAFGL